MRRGVLLLTMAFTFGMAGAALHAVQAGSGQAQLEVARRAEVIDGNLTGAIAQYQAIAERFKTTDRAVAVEALLRIAGCYQKQGNPRAQTVYNQVIQEYADQPQAVARARSGLGVQSGHLVERTLWSDGDLPNGDVVAVSPDGRSVAYTRSADQGDGALVLRDIASGRDRVLTSSGPIMREHAQYAVFAAFSRDGNRLAYDWRIQEVESGSKVKVVDELRVINLTDSGIPASRVVFRDENTEGYSVEPLDWSPDGERVVVVIGHGGDRTRQMGLVSVRDGALRVLRTMEWRKPSRVALSPDGRYLAYDLPADEHTGQRDIFVLASDGSTQVTAVGGPGRDEVVGWSPDGKRLLFTRDRLQLWAQPMGDGKPQGSPTIVKADARNIFFRLAASGDLFEFADVDDRAFYRVSVDFATGKSLGPAVIVPVVSPTPYAADWSPDGRSMMLMDSVAGDNVLSVLSLKAGDTRVLSVPLSFFDNNNFRWMPDGQSLLARAADMNGRLGMYRIDVANGAVTPVLLPPPGMGYSSPSLSKDGSKLYCTRTGGNDRVYVERDLTNGREREIVKLDRPNGTYGVVSPDGKYIGAVNISNGGSTPDRAQFTENKTWTVSVISTADGTEREILKVNPPVEFLGGPAVEWTPDSRFAVVRRVVGKSNELWAIPVAGGEAHKLDLGVPNYTGKQIRISPDGREIVVQVGTPVRKEIRMIEHFLQTTGK